MNTWLFILGYAGATIAVAVVIGIISVAAQKATEKKAEKKANEKLQKTADIISEANKTKADANTGDHKHDFNFMADKLHKLANK